MRRIRCPPRTDAARSPGHAARSRERAGGRAPGRRRFPGAEDGGAGVGGPSAERARPGGVTVGVGEGAVSRGTAAAAMAALAEGEGQPPTGVLDGGERRDHDGPHLSGRCNSPLHLRGDGFFLCPPKKRGHIGELEQEICLISVNMTGL